MKTLKLNKKGFTIVELVIVIAVIAILAAVLIPTFTGLVAEANKSADVQATKQMNNALYADQTLNGKPADFKEAIAVLAAANFNSEKALVPVYKNHDYWYSVETNEVILVDATNNAVVFPENFGTANLADETKFIKFENAHRKIDVATSNVEVLEDAFVAGNENITLNGDVKLENQVKIPAGANVTLDLNGYKLTTEKTGERSKYLDVAGTLTIVDGEIEARGIEVMAGGKLVIAQNSNVVVDNVDSNGGAAIWVYAGGTVEINGGTFTAMNGVDNLATLSSNPGVINSQGTVTINGGTFKSANTFCYLVQNNGGTMTINSGSFEGSHGIVATYGNGITTINGGTFKLIANGDGSFHGHVFYMPGNGKIDIYGGTFIKGGTDYTNDLASIKYGNVYDKR